MRNYNIGTITSQTGQPVSVYLLFLKTMMNATNPKMTRATVPKIENRVMLFLRSPITVSSQVLDI